LICQSNACLDSQAFAANAPRVLRVYERFLYYTGISMELVSNLTDLPVMENTRSQNAGRVLVVEDDDLLRGLIVEMLADVGFTASDACCADEALQLLKNQCDFVAMVTDVDMPGDLNGIALAAQVNEKWPWIGVVITSGAHRGGALGPRRQAIFLPKPFHADRLAVAVHSVIRAEVAPAHRRAS
jgi:DNA-binding NtrC family response regulator